MSVKPTVNWEDIMRLEREMQALVKEPTVSYEDLDNHLYEFRKAVVIIIINEIENGTTSAADSLLWDASCAINDRFRKLLARFKGSDQQRLVVEKQKLIKRYSRYLKASTSFYKEYIKNLDTHFGGIIDLRRIAHKLSLPAHVIEERSHSTPEIEVAINKAVHSSLIHLGDISRYYNDLKTVDKIWDRALAYYSLAVDVIPTAGSAYNQMAVVSLQVKNHLDAVYYLYRAMAIDEPHPRAKDNIELEFKKLLTRWKNNTPSVSIHHTPAESAAIGWLLRLHASLYKSQDLTNHDEIETEVICQTTALLKDQALEQEVLIKFALINIAAGHLALDRLKESPTYENKISYFGLLRLNVRTFFMLLQVLQPEFRSDDHEDLPGNEEQAEKITPVMGHVLPAFRHYSTWLVSQAETICALTSSEAGSNLTKENMEFIGNLRVYVKEMWREYASTLCLFCGAFPPRELHEFPDVDYLLAEDITTLGFKPFTDQEIAPDCDIHQTHEGTLKPRRTDQGVTIQEPRIEMICRIRSIIRDGVVIAHKLENTPIKIADGADGIFYFVEETVPSIRPTNGHSPGRSMSSLEMKRTLSERDEVRGYRLGGTVLPETEFTHESVELRMNMMVEDLIDSREDTYGMDTRAANELFAGVQAEQLFNSSSRTPDANALMPTFQNIASGFVPGIPNELEQAQREFPTIQSRQYAEADRLDTVTRGGIHSRRAYAPQHNENIPNASDNLAHRPNAPGGILTESELDKHMHMFNNPWSFSNSSWRNNSNIIAGTNTPLKSTSNMPQQAISTPSPYRTGVIGNHDMSSSNLTGSGLVYSYPGMYGNSPSYEREMMLQSSLPFSSAKQIFTPPPGQGSGQG